MVGTPGRHGSDGGGGEDGRTVDGIDAESAINRAVQAHIGELAVPIIDAAMRSTPAPTSISSVFVSMPVRVWEEE